MNPPTPDGDAPAPPLPGGPPSDEQVLEALLRVVSKVADGDFGEKPPIVEGDGPLAWFTVGFRFMVEDLERATGERAAEVERLRELDRQKSQFVNLAAHELRTPLTPIKMHLHLLRKGKLGALTPQQEASVEVLQRSFDRLNGLVEDLLQAARLQSQRLAVKPEPQDLAELVQGAATLYAGAAEQGGLALEVRAEPGVRVLADPARIGQVLANLLGNAAKFTPAGGRITLVAGRDGAEAAVRVVDTGPGLRGEDLPKLFRPFGQVESQQQAHPGGTGLGLYISKGLVQLHGGRMWAESPGPGQGATFAFTLPLAAEGGAQAAPGEDHAARRKEPGQGPGAPAADGNGAGRAVQAP